MLSIRIPSKGVLTGIPLIADKQGGFYTFKGMKEIPGDKGNTIELLWELERPAPSNQGKAIEPGQLGSKFFDRIRLYDKNTPPGEIPERAKIALFKRVDGCLGTGDPGNSKGLPERPDWDEATIEAMVGKVAFLRMKIDTFEGNDKNEVIDVKHPSQVQ